MRHLEHYREHGYAVVSDFLPHELVEDYAQWVAEEHRTLTNMGYGSVTGTFPVHSRLSTKITPVVEKLGSCKLLQDIVGFKHLRMHMPPMLRYMLPGTVASLVPPHQDAAYNTHLPEDFVTVWLPLVPITTKCGGIIIYDGSQNAPVSKLEPSEDGWFPAIDVSRYTPIHIIGVSLGDAVLLSPRVVHASAPNNSDDVRQSVDLRFFRGFETSKKHYLDLRRMEVVAP